LYIRPTFHIPVFDKRSSLATELWKEHWVVGDSYSNLPARNHVMIILVENNQRRCRKQVNVIKKSVSVQVTIRIVLIAAKARGISSLSKLCKWNQCKMGRILLRLCKSSTSPAYNWWHIETGLHFGTTEASMITLLAQISDRKDEASFVIRYLLFII